MSLLWKLLLSWFILSIAIMTVLQEWGEIAFALSFGVIYGGAVYWKREGIRSYINSTGMNRFPVYIVVCIIVSIAEELYVFALGNRTAVPDIWRDIVIVPGEWSVWFASWYLFLGKKFSFTTGEALFAAGVEGILFEYIGNGFIFSNPVGFVISIPLTIVVYAAIFMLPLQFISFTGSYGKVWKFPVSILMPYLFVIPVAVLLFVIIP